MNDWSSKPDAETHAIIGAALAVHRELGPGFLESVYQEAMGLELAARHIPFDVERLIQVTYRAQPLNAHFRADFVCFDSVVVELKALSALGSRDVAQTINYLKASGLERALLINFGALRLEQKRLLWTPETVPRVAQDC